MATTPSYIPLRDDAGLKSISKNERDFVRRCATGMNRSLRLDGRSATQSRPSRLFLTRHATKSGASLQWGTGTRVTASCVGEIVPPGDRPNEGIVHIAVELSPSASTSFRHVPPASNMGALMGNRGTGTADEAQKLETNRILRALERLMASCLDTEALVVTPGQWVWKLSLSVTVLDAAAGNLLDACWLAALAALQHYRQPHTEVRTLENDNQHNPLAPVLLSLDAKEGTPLPLHQVPFAVSFALIAEETDSANHKVVFLQDPSAREEMIAAGRFTYALNVYHEVCLVDFGGGAEIHPGLIREIHEAATKQVSILAKALQDTLVEADQEAVQQRLRSLKKEQPNLSSIVPPEDNDHEDTVDLPPLPEGEIQSPADLAAEEEYRKQALDYNLGHVAQPIAEGDRNKKSSKGTSALLASLLQSVSVAPESSKGEEHVATSPSKETKKVEADKPTKMDVDSDDEEETTMQLESEFSSVPVPGPTSGPSPRSKLSPQPPAAFDENDDVDDLAAAIKTKKKKKKKK
jgi:exosome complex RNA-binding protein Rrp42 (RNase PH superfamily)